MKVVIAPDKLKGSLSASSAARAIERGVRRARPDAEILLCPLADGGEGTLEALARDIRKTTVTGPLGRPLEARWGLADAHEAVIEMAEAAGLARTPEAERDPTRTTTYGVGELMRAALDEGVRRIVVGLGGSATTDGGAGMAQALGVVFESAPEPIGGGDLERIVSIDRAGIDPRLAGVEIVAACDVNDPLLAAARVYAAQKGATPAQVHALERGLVHLAELVPEAEPSSPGAGAAGGLGFGLLAFAGAKLVSGAELVLDALGFDQLLEGADLLLTGEGRLDAQSLSGKAAIAAARRARRRGVPAIALCGAIGGDIDRSNAPELTAWFSICEAPVTLDEAQQRAAELLEELAENVMRAR